jgi:mannan endo-1,4-beta-mannosidase
MVVHPGNSDRGPLVSRRAVLIGGGGAGAAGLVTSPHATAAAAAEPATALPAGRRPPPSDHIADGKAAGKPVVLEEYGLAVDAATGVPDMAQRDAGYSARTSAVADNGGAGDQFCLLTSRVDDGSFYPDYDGYRIYWFNDPGNAGNSTAHLLSAHAKALASA